VSPAAGRSSEFQAAGNPESLVPLDDAPPIIARFRSTPPHFDPMPRSATSKKTAPPKAASLPS